MHEHFRRYVVALASPEVDGAAYFVANRGRVGIDNGGRFWVEPGAAASNGREALSGPRRVASKLFEHRGESANGKGAGGDYGAAGDEHEVGVAVANA